MSVPQGRMPPFDRESEQAVLGAILLNNKVLPVVAAIVEEGDFFMDAHQRIYRAMLVLARDGVEIDAVTLGSALRATHDLDRVGGAMALASLSDAVASAENADHYARIVHERSAMRAVIYASQEMVARGYTGGPEDKIDEAFVRLNEAMQRLSRTRMPASLLGMGAQVLDNYDRTAHGYTGVPLPWPTLSAMTAGMWPQTMTMFVARPGTGKTFIAVIAARHAWQERHRVLVVSPEMSRVEIAERFFALHSGVSYLHMVKGTMSDFEMPRLHQAVDACKVQEGLWIMDAEDDLSPRGIEAAIRACKPDLVAIDSLYDLKLKGERRDKLLAALEWFKGAVKRYGVAGMGFVQLNRAAEVSEKKGGGVRLGTIALADEIGQDSHAVFALEQDKDMRADRKLRIKPLKLRRGAASVEGVEVNWDFDRMAFDEIPLASDAFEDDQVPF